MTTSRDAHLAASIDEVWSTCIREVCGREFMQPPEKVAVGRLNLWCSTFCYRADTGRSYSNTRNNLTGRSEVIRIARVMSVCARKACRRQFEQPPERLREGKPHRWCRPECFAADLADRQPAARQATVTPPAIRPEPATRPAPRPAATYSGPCAACQRRPALCNRDTWGLPICQPCRTTAYNSCWRKRVYTSSYSAMRWFNQYRDEGNLQDELSPYRCHLCARWHLTSWGPWEQQSEEYRTTIVNLATVIDVLNFNIDEARGYTLMPDGGHQPFAEVAG